MTIHHPKYARAAGSAPADRMADVARFFGMVLVVLAVGAGDLWGLPARDGNFTLSGEERFGDYTMVDSALVRPRLLRSPSDSAKDRSAQSTPRTKTYKANTVVVTGTRNDVLQRDSPVRVEVIDAQDTKTTSMVNIGDLLREQTGMLLTNNVREGVQIMGLNSDYTLILIDGQPMIGRVAGVLDLSRVSVGNIERVEVVKGPMSSLYGTEALAGVINIITRKPESGFSGRAYSQALTRGPLELQTEANWGLQRWEINSYLNAKRAPSFELQQGDFRSPVSGFQDFTGQARAKWYATDNFSTSADLRLFRAESQGVFSESFFGQVAFNSGSVVQSEASGNWSTNWTRGKARLSTQVYASRYGETYNFDTVQGDGRQTDNLERQQVRTYVQYDLVLNARNRLTFGNEINFDDIWGSRYPDRPSFRTSSLFAQWEGNPTDWVSYALSGRYVSNNAFENPGLGDGRGIDSALLNLMWLSNPKLAINFKLPSNVRFHMSVGTGFKVPDFRQLYVEFSNRLAGAGYDLIGARRLGLDLKPERSTAFDLGLVVDEFDAEIGPISIEGMTEARVFRNYLSNLIEFFFVREDPDTRRALYSYRNLSRVVTEGLEYNIRLRTPIDDSRSLGINLGYQYLRAFDVEVLEAIDAGRAGTVDPQTGRFKPLRRADYGGLWFRSPHSGVLRLQLDDKEHNYSANLRAQYIGRFGNEALDINGNVLGNPPRKVPDLPQEFVSGYVMLNAGFTKTFSLGSTQDSGMLDVTIGANNILDHLDLRSLPNLVGRQFFTNIAWRWN